MRAHARVPHAGGGRGFSPWPKKVFALPFVTAVFVSGNFVTVTKNEAVDWDRPAGLREYIQEYLNTDGRVLYEDAPAQALAEANGQATSHAAPAGEDDRRIVEVLDEYVRPAVEGDGGHIAFRSYKDGVVTVTLQGISCSGCPAAWSPSRAASRTC